MQIKKMALALTMALSIGGTGYFNHAYGQSKTLKVYDWSGYDDPVFFKPYMDKYKKSPTFSFFAEEEEAKAKMSTGFKVDISHPCSYSTNRWREAGIIQPIDTSRLKNYKNLTKRYRELPGFVSDGKVWVIPYDIGQTALTYNADKVPEKDVRSLKVFIDPKYKGKISLPDNFSDWISLGLLATGSGTKLWQGINSPDDPRYKKALEFLRAVHKNNKFYWTDGPNLAAALKTGEVLITWAWNETPITLRNEGMNVKMNRDTKEGFASYVCGYVWTKASNADPQLVYDFLDAVISEPSTLPMVDGFGYAHSNSVGMKNLPKDVLDRSVVSNNEKYIKKAGFQVPLPDHVIKFMNDDFNRIKTGN